MTNGANTITTTTTTRLISAQLEVTWFVITNFTGSEFQMQFPSIKQKPQNGSFPSSYLM